MSGKEKDTGTDQQDFHISPGKVYVRSGSLEVRARFPDGKYNVLLYVDLQDFHPSPSLDFPAES